MDTGRTGALGTNAQSLVVLVSEPVNAHAPIHHHQPQLVAKMVHHAQAAHKRLSSVLCLGAGFKGGNIYLEQQTNFNLISQFRANEVFI